MTYFFTLHNGNATTAVLADRGNDAQQHQNSLGAADQAALKSAPTMTQGLPAKSVYQLREAASHMYGIPLLKPKHHVLIAASDKDIKLWVVAGEY